MQILIVDDEAPARDRLRRMLGAEPDTHVVGEAVNGIEALEAVERLHPDVVFLDIDMPELDGFGVAEKLGTTGPSIVFVTAYDQHALRAFEANAVDYLVKPVAKDRLKKTLGKLQQRHGTLQEAWLKSLLTQVTSRAPLTRFAVRCGSRFVAFDPKEVSALLARTDYTAIVLGDRELLADDSLDTLVERLDPAQFSRIHRSGVINIAFLKELVREGDRKYVAVLNDLCETRVPVSRERLNDLKSRLGIKE